MTKEEFISLGLTEEQAEKAATASAKELEGYVAKGEYDAKVKELETAKGSIADLTDKLKDFDGVNEVNINNRSWRLQPFNKIHLKSKYLRIFCTYIGNKDLKKLFSANIQLFVSNYIDSCKSYKELTTALFFETPKTQNRFRKVKFIFINNMKNILKQQHSAKDARYI